MSSREHEINLRRVNSATRRGARRDANAGALRARQAQLEESIRRCARHATGAGPALIDEPSRSQLAAALGDAALVELIELDGTLTALTLLRREPAPPRARTNGADQRAAGLVALRAHSFGRVRRTREQRDASTAGALASALALDRLLLQPLSRSNGERPPGAGANRGAARHSVGGAAEPAWPCTRRRSLGGHVAWTPGADLRACAARSSLSRAHACVTQPLRLEAVGALYDGATMLGRRQATVTAVTEAAGRR